ncbi:MAG: aminotransferase class I and II [Deltaproteobacteria bacterium]|nr:aminotransferase class I and II [Deltaproteobacteria bacterium]
MEPLRLVHCTRYVMPLREGGSLPAIVEADDQGMYVMKFHGAGQGPKALVAEVVGALLGRALGLPVPELVLVEMDAGIARLEGHDDVRDLLTRSTGLNLGLDYLPGCITFDPAVPPGLDEELASRIVWFDSVIANVDRTPRNTNMLWWHRRAWLIDHGAALVFQHDWEGATSRDVRALPPVAAHVLLPRARSVQRAHDALRPLVTRALLEEILAQVPAAWLAGDSPFPDENSRRAAYVQMLLKRADAAGLLAVEVGHARARV